MSPIPTIVQSVGTFVATYAVATTATVIPVLVVRPGRYDKSRWEKALKKALAASKHNFKYALLPVFLPVVYRAADRFLTPKEDSQHSTPKPKHLRIVKRFRSVLPALLSSPLFILLPESIRTEVALYFFSTFLYTFADAKLSRKEIKFEADNDTKDANETKRIWQRSRKEILENWRDYLPPAWTVSMMANTFLLWTFIFEPYAFPERYHDAIIKHSSRYLPHSRPLDDIRDVLRTTQHGVTEGCCSPHSFLLCEHLHPTEVSCFKNFFAAFKDEAVKFSGWVAGATVVSMLISGKLQFGKRKFTVIVFEFIDNAIRGTAFLSGSITSVWALSCVLQRIIPAGRFSKSRWIINSSLSSMWILLLSQSQQFAVSIYQFRLATFSVWKVWKARGGRSIKHGELWLIAACWVALLHYKDRTVGNRITGVIGQLIGMIDGTEFAEWNAKKKGKGKGKGKDDGSSSGWISTGTALGIGSGLAFVGSGHGSVSVSQPGPSTTSSSGAYIQVQETETSSSSNTSYYHGHQESYTSSTSTSQQQVPMYPRPRSPLPDAHIVVGGGYDTSSAAVITHTRSPAPVQSSTSHSSSSSSNTAYFGGALGAVLGGIFSSSHAEPEVDKVIPVPKPGPPILKRRPGDAPRRSSTPPPAPLKVEIPSTRPIGGGKVVTDTRVTFKDGDEHETVTVYNASTGVSTSTGSTTKNTVVFEEKEGHNISVSTGLAGVAIGAVIGAAGSSKGSHGQMSLPTPPNSSIVISPSNSTYGTHTRDTSTTVVSPGRPAPETPGCGPSQYATQVGYGTNLGLPTPASSRTPSAWEPHAPTAGPLPGQPSNWELYGKPYEAHPASTTGVSTTIATGAADDKTTSTYYKDGRDHKDVAISLGGNGQQVIDVYHSQPVPMPYPVGYPTRPTEGVSIIDTKVTVGKGDHGHHDTVMVQDSTIGSSTTTTGTSGKVQAGFGFAAGVGVGIGAGIAAGKIISHTQEPTLPSVSISAPSVPHLGGSISTSTSSTGVVTGSFGSETHVHGTATDTSSSTNTSSTSTVTQRPSPVPVQSSHIGFGGQVSGNISTSISTSNTDVKQTSAHQDSTQVTVTSSSGSGQQIIDVHHQPVSVPVPYPVPVGYPARPTSGVSTIDTQVTVGTGESVTHGHHDSTVIVQDSTVGSSTTTTTTGTSGKVQAGLGFAAGVGIGLGAGVVAGKIISHTHEPASPSVTISTPSVPHVGGSISTSTSSTGVVTGSFGSETHVHGTAIGTSSSTNTSSTSTVTQRPAPVPVQSSHIGFGGQ
ncbi:hypothetical protein FRC04_006711, partial [Tulasnella sp. 424]